MYIYIYFNIIYIYIHIVFLLYQKSRMATQRKTWIAAGVLTNCTFHSQSPRAWPMWPLCKASNIAVPEPHRSTPRDARPSQLQPTGHPSSCSQPHGKHHTLSLKEVRYKMSFGQIIPTWTEGWPWHSIWVALWPSGETRRFAIHLLEAKSEKTLERLGKGEDQHLIFSMPTLKKERHKETPKTLTNTKRKHVRRQHGTHTHPDFCGIFHSASTLSLREDPFRHLSKGQNSTKWSCTVSVFSYWC